MGGSGDDDIDAGTDTGRDIVLGDHGEVNFDAQGRLTSILTTDVDSGGNDRILAGDGSDVVLGGSGNDDIDAGSDSGRDIVLGDNGTALFDLVTVDLETLSVLREVRTADPEQGGSDFVRAGDGDDVVLGGSGADYSSVDRNGVKLDVDTGDDVILGDNGWAQFDTTTGSSVLTYIVTADPTTAADGSVTDWGAGDFIYAADGSDVVLGGSGDDDIDAGTDTGRDIVLGDHGEVNFDAQGRLTSILTTDVDSGGNDRILAGDGSDVVLGGSGNDDIDAGSDSGRDIVLGDNGTALFDLVTVDLETLSVLREVRTADPEQGGSDFVRAGDGDDVVLGGSGADYLSVDRNGVKLDVDTGDDVILGDNGWAQFDTTTGSSVLTYIVTADPTTAADGSVTDWGAGDFIYAADGSDVVLGGSGDDDIDAGTDTGRDIVLGDHGEVNFDAQGRLTSILTTDVDSGGNDRILAGDGSDVVLGGSGNDDIDAGSDSGRDIVLGDNGTALFDLVTVDLETLSVLREVRTADPEQGGSDFVRAGDGDDVVLGGSGADYLSVDRNGVKLDVDTGDDVILGDNGWAQFDTTTGSSVLTYIVTADPTTAADGSVTDWGAGDFIYAADGSDVVLGGSGDDDIDAGTDTGRDIVLGDHGEVNFDAQGRLTSILTTDVDSGGNDRILAGDGSDVVLGGSGNDDIDAGSDSGRDIVLGDNGTALFDLVTVDLETLSVLREVRTADPEQGGSDFVRAGDGDDVVLGGSGADYLSVDRNGVKLDVDTGDDVILGDNGWAQFDTTTGSSVLTYIVTADPTTAADGSVTDWGAGDFIYAADGSDVVLGGSGDDDIDAGTDTGRDIVLGDHGEVNFRCGGRAHFHRNDAAGSGWRRRNPGGRRRRCRVRRPRNGLHQCQSADRTALRS